MSFLPLKFNGKTFRNVKEEEDEDKQIEELPVANNLFAVKINNFILVYEKLKAEGIGNQKNSLINVLNWRR